MLVERDVELAAIHAALEHAAQGRGSTLIFCGEAGIGKSALLASATGIAPGRVLTMRGAETETELPFAGLRDLVAPLADAVSDLPPPQRMALLGALAVEEVDRVEPFGVFTATLSLLSAAADPGPLLILADDVQWLDSGSVDALRFVAGRLASEPIVMLLAARKRPADFDRPGVRVHALRRLSARGTERLLSAQSPHLGRRELAEQLHRATGGNPLALRELARSEPELTLARATALAPLPVGDAIRESFARRLSALSAPARIALILAATAQRDDMGLLAEAASSCGLTIDAYVEAEAAEAIALEDGRLSFQHPLLRSVVYADSTAAERRAAHAALATAAARLSRPEEAAWHRAAATVMPDEAVAAALDAAAAGYERRSGHIAAAQALELAAKLTPSGDSRARRLHRAAEAARRAGDADWARALLDEALALADAPALLAHIEFTRVLLTAWSDSTATARDGYEALAARLRDTDPDAAAKAYAYASAQAIVEGKIDTARADAAQSSALLAAHAMSEYSTAVVRHADAIVRVLSGAPDGPGALRAAAHHLLDTGQLSGREYLALPLVWIEDYGLARALIDSRLADARRCGELRALTAALEVDATLRYRIGDWAGAHAAAAESARLSRESHQLVQLAYSLATLSIVQAAQGDEDALRSAAEAQELAAGHGLAELEQYVTAARGLAHLGRERPDVALEQLQRAERYAMRAGQREPAVHQWPADLIEAAVALRRPERARAVATRLGEAAGRPWAQAVAARARGMLAAGGQYDAHFADALAWEARTVAPFERARAHLWWGRRLRRDRRKVDARRELEAALDDFEALGARPWIDMARRELRATGATLRRIDIDTRDELTPQEHQIAGLVAAGASNKDVAASMFLSPKTVETHLSRIYRKVGVRSRYELIRAMASSEAEGAEGGAAGPVPSAQP